MKNLDVLLGLQFGDEGKGAFVDRLVPEYHIVTRFQGGPNAGHTLEFNGKQFILHIIPSGIFREGIVNVIGNGVVLDPITFSKEINGISPTVPDCLQRIIVSDKAKIIIPTHRFIDDCNEWKKGRRKIGSTLKGIGPTYENDVGRIGLRMGDIFKQDFEEKYFSLKEFHVTYLRSFNYPLGVSKIDKMSLDELEDKFFEAIDFVRNNVQVRNTEYYLNEAMQFGKKILAEGAQGTLLDIQFGTYPFVTSSNVTSGGVAVGLGVPPNSIENVYCIFKAYTTRVGNGPFSTELYHKDNPNFQDPNGKLMAEFGKEFGSTTGRPRRCGWLDLPALKYACMINGVTELLMTKADVLSSSNGFDIIKVAVSYDMKDGSFGSRFYPDQLDEILNPIYKDFESWPDIYGIDSIDQIPKQLQDYIDFIQDYLKIPIRMVSTGPDRDHMVLMVWFWSSLRKSCGFCSQLFW